MPSKKLDVKALEGWLWNAACQIRGEVDAPKYKDYILPLVFVKRLSDVFDDEIKKLSEKYGSADIAEQLVKEDKDLVRFYLPEKARWRKIFVRTTGTGEHLTDAVRTIARENPKLHGVIDRVDYNATESGQRIITDETLKLLVDVLNKYRLGLEDVEPDILGRAYEYLLRKFAEGSGQSAGEFYTPREVAILMSHILNPEAGMEIYDPCCGSGGLLIKCYLRYRDLHAKNTSLAPLRFYGQEIIPSTFSMSKMNVFIHDMEAEIRLGDTMKHPAFLYDDGSLRKFDIVVANPKWNQDFPQDVYENDTYNRFGFGFPTSSTADWGWIQHMFASLKDNGRMAVVLDTGSVSRGSGNQGSNRERDIRKEFVERDLIDAVILKPENLFYNTTSSGVILVINKAKKKKNEILLINASKLFQKRRPKNFLPDEKIEQISKTYHDWQVVDGISKVVTLDEVRKNDYNLGPSRYVSQDGKDDTLSLEDAVVLLKEAEEEAHTINEELKAIMQEIGIQL